MISTTVMVCFRVFHEHTKLVTVTVTRSLSASEPAPPPPWKIPGSALYQIRNISSNHAILRFCHDLQNSLNSVTFIHSWKTLVCQVLWWHLKKYSFFVWAHFHMGINIRGLLVNFCTNTCGFVSEFRNVGISLHQDREVKKISLETSCTLARMLR